MASGLLPKGWNEVELGSVLKRIKRPVDLDSARTYREIGIRSHGKGIFHKEERTGESIGEKSVFWVEPDCFIVNIVFAWEQAIAKTTASEKGMIASHRFPMFKPVQGKLDLDYLVYFFNSPRGKYLLGLASPGGAARNKTLGQQEFLNLTIPLPSYNEQCKVVEILSTWDKAIALGEKLLATKQRLKTGLIQKLTIGSLRFQEFVVSPKRKLSLFGEIPLDWSVEKIEDVASVAFSNVDKVIEKNETPVLLCNYLDVFNNSFITNDLPFMKASAKKREIDKFTLFKGDVIITKDSETAEEIAEAAVVAEELKNTICGYHLAVIRPHNNKIDGTFLMYVLHNQKIRHQFVKSANGVTRYGLTTDSINRAKIIIPSLPEQQKISSSIKVVDTEISLFNKKLSVLKRQKKGLMQKLLSGQIRVKV